MSEDTQDFTVLSTFGAYAPGERATVTFDLDGQKVCELYVKGPIRLDGELEVGVDEQGAFIRAKSATPTQIGIDGEAMARAVMEHLETRMSSAY